MGEQLGHRFDVPVGEPDPDVAEVGGQLRQLALDVEAGPVPLDQPPRREGVALMPAPALAPLCRVPDYAGLRLRAS
jgi:hypothetical protein